MGSKKGNIYRLKEILRIISKTILRMFRSSGEILLVSLFLGVVITLLELRIFSIPRRYADGIWLTNTIIAFIAFLVSKKSTKDRYQKKIENLVNGHPFEEEFYQYENELKQIDEKYRGEEAYKKIREFIVRKRMENTLKRINLN